MDKKKIIGEATEHLADAVDALQEIVEEMEPGEEATEELQALIDDIDAMRMRVSLLPTT
jgi:signal transduction histidine kinase